MSLVKARVALVVLELEGEIFEVSSVASSLISQAIVSAFRAHDATEYEPDDEAPTPGEVKQ